MDLVEATFRWAREAKPSQPLTTCIYGSPQMRQRISELADILSFHNYGPLPGLKAEVAHLLVQGRPLVCTEWMARRGGSRFETHLPFFNENKVGCWNWGLVAGRTQTFFPWDSKLGAPEPKLWFHDIFRRDGVPFHEREVQFIKAMTGKWHGALPTPVILVPTAATKPVPWLYTLEEPATGWFRPEFNDSTWSSGFAPFGREETPIARKPNTVWTNADIWLRREFSLPPDRFTEFALSLHHDEDVEVYLNGVLAAQTEGFNAAYETVEIRPEAQAALRPGQNTMAVHCRQTVGGQYIDVGIEAIAGSKAQNH